VKRTVIRWPALAFREIGVGFPLIHLLDLDRAAELGRAFSLLELDALGVLLLGQSRERSRQE